MQYSRVEASTAYVSPTIQIKSQLSRGSYGRVFIGQQKEHPHLYFLIKQIRIKHTKKQDIEMIKREMQRLKDIWSPYLVKLYGYQIIQTEVNKKLCLYFDYCEGGTLEEHLAAKKSYVSENEALIILRQIIQAYSALYRHKYIHRDIKTSNILLHQGKIKLTGMVFGSVIKYLDFASIRVHSILSIYGSPEMQLSRGLQQNNHSNKCDVWSLGIVLYEILFGRKPFDHKTYIKELNQGRVPNINWENPRRNEAATGLLQSMLQFHEADRISWDELFNNPLFHSPLPNIEINPNKYGQMMSVFNVYMKYNQVRGFFRINIDDNQEQEIDTSLTFSELQQKQRKSRAVFKSVMRDRNETMFFSSIIWVYYRARTWDEENKEQSRIDRRVRSQILPTYVNPHCELQFIILNKVMTMLRRYRETYIKRRTTPLKFQDDSWRCFVMHHEYKRFHNLLNQDMLIIQGMLDAVRMKMDYEQIWTEKSKRAAELLAKNNENEEFMKIYTDILIEHIVRLKKDTNVHPACLLLMEYMETSFFPEHTFVNNNFDFYLFYENCQRRYGLEEIFKRDDYYTAQSNQSSLVRATVMKNIDSQQLLPINYIHYRQQPSLSFIRPQWRSEMEMVNPTMQLFRDVSKIRTIGPTPGYGH